MKCLYYTDNVINDKKVFTQLCLLFDEVSTIDISPDYFLKPFSESWEVEKNKPIYTKSPAEKELITSIHVNNFNNFLNENRVLLKEKLLVPLYSNAKPQDWINYETNKKRLFEDGDGLIFGLWGQTVGIIPNDKIYIDSPWYSLYRWQAISGSLHFAISNKYVAISDNKKLSYLGIATVTKYSKLDYKPSIEEISSLLAFNSLSMLLPNFPELKPEEVLETRYKVKDELDYFKIEMKNVVEANIPYLPDQMELIINNKIKPRVEDIKNKIKGINSELFRKIANFIFAAGGTSTILGQYLDLPILSQVVALASSIGRVTTLVHENISKKNELLNESKNKGLALLIKKKSYFK